MRGVDTDKHKVLFYDLEVAPRKSYVYGNSYEPKEMEVIEDGYIVSFAYKWQGEDEVTFVGLNQYSGYFKTKRAALVSDLWLLFEQADVVVAHNGNKFDQKISNTYFIKQGHTPPSPYYEVDTLKIARRVLNIPSFKLDDLAKELGIKGKTGHSAANLCIRIDKGEDCWADMERYNKQDVVILERVYNKLQAWVKNLPSNGSFGYTCPRCPARSRLQKWGFINNKPRTARYQRYKCPNCGYHAQGTKALDKDEYEKADVK